MNFLISTAFADTTSTVATAATAQEGIGSAFMNFLPFILMLVVFYFLLIRPQQKRMKQHRETLSQIRRGDRVLTSGGIIGIVSKVVDDTEVLIEIADNVKVRVLKATIADVMTKTEPVKDDSAQKETALKK